MQLIDFIMLMVRSAGVEPTTRLRNPMKLTVHYVVLYAFNITLIYYINILHIKTAFINSYTCDNI